MRKTFLPLTTLALAGALAFASVAGAGELAGVKLPDTTRVGDKTLMLNGMGLRTKMIFKVYAAGLYLPAKQSDPAKILAEDTPRKLELLEALLDVGGGARRIVGEAFGPGFGDFVAADAAHELHLELARAVLGEDLGGVALLGGQVKAGDVHLGPVLGAQAEAVEHQGGVAGLGAVGHLDAGQLAGAGRRSEGQAPRRARGWTG